MDYRKFIKEDELDRKMEENIKYHNRISEQMLLDIHNNLAEIAQYYKNQYGRQGLNSVIFDEFAKVPKDNENVRWLAKMPIKEY